MEYRRITPESDEWPHWAFMALALAADRGDPAIAPPNELWVAGQPRLDRLADRAVAIVGSRAPTGYGEYIAADWTYTLAGDGITVVSGGSYGIEGAAHRGALAADGSTIAVLAAGVDADYPAGHSLLFGNIVDRGGLLVSEYPPTTPPSRSRFAERNRIVAALSAGTVAVEAGPRSGTLNTVSHANRIGRTVMAVPGPVNSAASRGTNELIRTGTATLVTSAHDILDAIRQRSAARTAK